MLKQGDHLDCLTEAHVVSKAATETEAVQEGEPGKASFLIRTQCSIEVRRDLHGARRVVGNSVLPEQFRDPTVGTDAGDGRHLAVFFADRCQAKDFAEGRCAAGMLVEEDFGSLEVFGADLDPCIANPNQGNTVLRESAEFLESDVLISDRDFPRVVDEA